MSQLVLILHVLIFAGFTLASLSTPVIAYKDPATFSDPLIVGLAVCTMAVVMLSWRIAGGCPLTAWENQLRRRQGKAPYNDACIDHYTYAWFSLRLPAKFSTRIIVVLLALPIATSLVTWL